VCFRTSEGGQSPCIPSGTIFLNLWWLVAGKQRTVERMLPEFSWFERERPSELWEFPQNLKTHLSDLKSHMPPTRSHLWELKPSSKTVQGGGRYKLRMNSTILNRTCSYYSLTSAKHSKSKKHTLQETLLRY